MFLEVRKFKLLFILILCLIQIDFIAIAQGYHNDYKIAEEALREFPKSSIAFTENKGQFVNNKGEAIPYVLFKTSLRGVDMYITTKGITYVFLKYKAIENAVYEPYTSSQNGVYEEAVKEMEIEWCRLDMDIVGSTIIKENIITEQPSKQGVSNYYLAHCPDGILNVKSYHKITIKSIYPGIDWIIYADDEEGLKYDFVVSPGTDPDVIKLQYKGAKDITVSDNGKFLNLKMPFGELHEGEIDCYEGIPGKKINSNYVLKDSTISFDISNFDNSQSLIIDPPLELVWSTYYGGSGFDMGVSITTDQSGNVLVTGNTTSTDFPTFNPGGGTYYQGANLGVEDIMILKFNNSGQRLWATYYGGSDRDFGNSITIDPYGNIFITGSSYSTDFPTYNSGGGAYYQDSINSSSHTEDVIVLKFSDLGQILWSTYYGSWIDDVGYGITCDQVGNIFITGWTAGSFQFPHYYPGGGAYYQLGGSIFILKFNNSGVRLWATTYGGNGSDHSYSITTDIFNNVFITGLATSTDFPVQNPGGGAYFQSSKSGLQDAFIVKFNNAGQRLWATYFGGSLFDKGISIDADQSGNIYVFGTTESVDFPTYNPGGGAFFQTANAGLRDAFILKFDSSCCLKWSTYFGGNQFESSSTYYQGDRTISTDISGNIFICFGTSSPNMPTSQKASCGYFQGSLTGSNDIFITEFTKDLTLDWSSYFYGSTEEIGKSIAVDTGGCIFTIGHLNPSAPNSVIDTMNPGNGAYFQPVHAGGTEIGIMKFCPCCP